MIASLGVSRRFSGHNRSDTIIHAERNRVQHLGHWATVLFAETDSGCESFEKGICQSRFSNGRRLIDWISKTGLRAPSDHFIGDKVRR